MNGEASLNVLGIGQTGNFYVFLLHLKHLLQAGLTIAHAGFEVV